MEVSFEARVFRPSSLTNRAPPELVPTARKEDYVTPARAKQRASAGTVWEVYGKGKPGDVALSNRALEISMQISQRQTRGGKRLAPRVVLNELGVQGIADTMV